jgi:hypothetical protein
LRGEEISRDDGPEYGCDDTLASHSTERSPSELADGGKPCNRL